MNEPAAIYARVSSDRQKENHTIASQTAAPIEYAQTHGYSVPPEWVFQDEGYSGAILERRTVALRSGVDLSEGASGSHAGGSTPGAVSGYDRRI